MLAGWCVANRNPLIRCRTSTGSGRPRPLSPASLGFVRARRTIPPSPGTSPRPRSGIPLRGTRGRGDCWNGSRIGGRDEGQDPPRCGVRLRLRDDPIIALTNSACNSALKFIAAQAPEPGVRASCEQNDRPELRGGGTLRSQPAVDGFFRTLVRRRGRAETEDGRVRRRRHVRGSDRADFPGPAEQLARRRGRRGPRHSQRRPNIGGPGSVRTWSQRGGEVPIVEIVIPGAGSSVVRTFGLTQVHRPGGNPQPCGGSGSSVVDSGRLARPLSVRQPASCRGRWRGRWVGSPTPRNGSGAEYWRVRAEYPRSR